MIDIYKRVRYSQSMTYMAGLFVARGKGRTSREVARGIDKLTTNDTSTISR